MRSITLLLLACSFLHAQQADIQGIAIDAVTRQPMAGVHITMRAMSADDLALDDNDSYGAITRRDGHFSITGLKPALYILAAQHNGYLHRPDDVPLALKPGDQIKDCVVEMTQHAVIVGHVLDENGDPVQHVEIRAEPAAAASPRQSMWMQANGRTDDRGQFRIAVPPGKYYIQAMARGPEFGMAQFGPPEIRTDGQAPAVYGATFYPGALSKDRATPVELAPGQEVTGIDIHLAQKRSVKISGTVTGIPANPNLGIPAFVSLFPSREPSGETPNHFESPEDIFTAPDGTFTISGLTPGRYRAVARFQSPDGVALQSAPVDVRPESADETGVTLALVPGQSVSGTLEIEGDSAKSKPAEKLNVRLEAEPDRGRAPAAEVGEEGYFRMEQVFPERLRVRVTPMPENAYVKSVKLGDSEAPDGMLDLSRGVTGASIHITLNRNGGQLEGTVTGEDGAAMRPPFALVVLVDSAGQIGEQNLKPVRAGEKFRYAGLRPGKYRLIAINPLEFSGDPGNVSALTALLPNAPEIEIHEGDRIVKDVKVTAAGKVDAK